MDESRDAAIPAGAALLDEYSSALTSWLVAALHRLDPAGIGQR